jgi:hypothetical protein
VPADGDGNVGVGGKGLEILRQALDTPSEPGDGLRQFADAPPGEVLLVCVVLLENTQALNADFREGETD